MAAVYGRGRWELHVPDCGSLKDKRRVVQGMRDRVRSRLKISVAETDFQGDRRRAEICVAFVASDSQLARSILDRADELISSDPRVYVVATESELH